MSNYYTTLMPKQLTKQSKPEDPNAPGPHELNSFDPSVYL
jgi:hypothetical protein